MKYEICKEIENDGVAVWSAFAWTDVRMYAEQIVKALNTVDGGQYAVRTETPAGGEDGH